MSAPRGMWNLPNHSWPGQLSGLQGTSHWTSAPLAGSPACEGGCVPSRVLGDSSISAHCSQPLGWRWASDISPGPLLGVA